MLPASISFSFSFLAPFQKNVVQRQENVLCKMKIDLQLPYKKAGKMDKNVGFFPHAKSDARGESLSGGKSAHYLQKSKRFPLVQNRRKIARLLTVSMDPSLVISDIAKQTHLLGSKGDLIQHFCFSPLILHIQGRPLPPKKEISLQMKAR